MADMELERLRYFKLVAETGHLRETAELVGLSPGALSRSLKVLETELGVKLFRQVGKRLVLTERGRTVHPLAARLVDEYASFRKAVAEEMPPSPPLLFCSHSVFTTYFLGYALKHHLRAEVISARNVAPGAIEESVVRRESDFGLTYLPVPTAGIAFVPVARITMGAFVRRGAFRSTPFDEIPCSVPILRISNAVPGGATVDAWPDRISRKRARFHFDLLETALESCRQGLSWGCFPKFVAWLHNRQVKPEFAIEPLAVPRLARPTALRAFLVKRADDEESTAMKAMCSALRSVCKAATGHFDGDASQ